jgi:hypothetical protein
LVVAGLGALALGGLTAWLALSGPSESPAAIAAKGDDGDESKGNEPTPPGEPAVFAEDASAEAAGDGDGDEEVIEVVDDAETGKLSVAGPRGAKLFVDDSEVGALPYEGTIAAGTHELRVEAAGYAPWEGSVKVTTDKPASVEAELRKPAKPGKTPRRPKKPGPAPSKPEPKSPVPSPSTTDAPDPPKKPDKKPDKKKDDVFINPDKGNDSNGIFLPVGK